jgi:sec-independent protein translocase protein TatA
MTLAAIFGLSGGGVILILACVLILFGAKKLPELAEGLWRGFDEFREGVREVVDEIAVRLDGEIPNEMKTDEPSHPFFFVLTFVLGSLCLFLVLYELSK